MREDQEQRNAELRKPNSERRSPSEMRIGRAAGPRSAFGLRISVGLRSSVYGFHRFLISPTDWGIVIVDSDPLPANEPEQPRAEKARPSMGIVSSSSAFGSSTASVALEGEP